ncbi:tetratricopeptide repeat protein [Oscillatoria acuminata]|uniref:Tetratricopeptide repeat protein n=1 Tax=Oscillatoria acuminata PCC 6304 TaxID=56110 RepID=K9TKB2_9CYAN|nr:hypothetical protein [Oscillatoria acuminata]AFY82459.1 hypothetical protein Oscil6304_2857 [Oscillatoria acuminata PCC 6304]
MPKIYYYPPSSPETPGNSGLWLRYLMAVVLGLFCGGMLLRSHFNKQDYKRGYEAYKTGDCPTAIGNFNGVIHRWSPVDAHQLSQRAQTRKTECETYQQAITEQQNGKSVSSLITYNNLLANHPTTELRPLIHQNAAQLFAETKPTQLTEPEFCQQLESFRRHEIIPGIGAKLPAFYRDCGDRNQAEEKYSQAVIFYEQFLKAYPDHEIAPTIKEKLVQTLIAEAQQQGAATILRPPASGTTESGYTVLQIQNDSPSRMQLVFSGPEDRIEELEPCFDCETYFGKGPETCPGLGPIGRYTVPPGDYKILVKSIDEYQVTPYRGDWNLEDSLTYQQCFYIIRDPLRQQQPVDLERELSKTREEERRSQPSHFGF